MKKTLLLLVMVLFARSAAGQENFSSELRFIHHLQSRGHLKEAMFLLDNLQSSDPSQSDSLNYYRGWIQYGQKRLEESAWYLLQVSDKSPFYEKSQFFAAYNYVYLGRTQDAVSVLKTWEGQTSDEVQKMVDFQLSGIALLERRLNDYLKTPASRGSFGFLETEEQNLRQYYTTIAQRSNRSPLVAGLLSAAVPGLGKIYAGKTSEGMAGLLYVSAMALVSFELYNRNGITDPFFILAAGLTTVFYTGNILGSAAAVRRSQKEFNHEIDQRILLNLHIPLRNLYP
jgi:TM2 domain-containing membrane protein YozV